MILNAYIHEPLATAHQRDLLEAADRDRRASHARARPGARLGLRWPAPRRRAALERRRSAPTPTAATR